MAKYITILALLITSCATTSDKLEEAGDILADTDTRLEQEQRYQNEAEKEVERLIELGDIDGALALCAKARLSCVRQLDQARKDIQASEEIIGGIRDSQRNRSDLPLFVLYIIGGGLLLFGFIARDILAILIKSSIIVKLIKP